MVKNKTTGCRQCGTVCNRPDHCPVCLGEVLCAKCSPAPKPWRTLGEMYQADAQKVHSQA